MTAPWPWPRSMLLFAATFVAVLALGFLPIPAGTAPLRFGGLLHTFAALLVACRGGVALVAAARPSAARSLRRLAGAIYVVVAGLLAWMWFDGLAADGLIPQGGQVLRVATAVGGSAVLWLLADLVSSTGRFHGSAAVFGMSVWLWLVGVARGAGERIALQEADATTAAIEVAGLLAPLVVVIVAQLAAPNDRWPLPLWPGVAARSALDLVLLAVGAGMLAADRLRWFTGGGALQTAGCVAGSVALFLLAYRDARIAGAREPRLLPPLAVLPTLAGGAVLWGFSDAGGFRPGPYDGDVRARAVLETRGGSAERDRAIFASRLAEMGVEADVRALDADHVGVALHGVNDATRVLADLLPRRRFTIAEEGGPPFLWSADIADAGMVWTRFGEPAVSIELTERGRRVFGERTANNVGKTLIISLDDEVVMAPRVREPILGGYILIELGSSDPAEAAAMAAGLATPPLQGDWWLASLEEP